MSIEVQPGDTPFSLAQRLLGDGRATDQLVIDGWDGNPNRLPVGNHARARYEKPGPPARWAADPARLGSYGHTPDAPSASPGSGPLDAAGRPIHG